jgi:hypothetical protein
LSGQTSKDSKRSELIAELDISKDCQPEDKEPKPTTERSGAMLEKLWVPEELRLKRHRIVESL